MFTRRDDSTPAESPPLAPIAARYEIVRPLGRGGFAQTWLARDIRDGRQVALKALQSRTAPDWKSFELFEREAAVLRELRHHAIPVVHEAFRATLEGNEAAFIALEYIEGTSLAEQIANRRHFDTDAVLHLFAELLGVLDYLHSRVPPILHRDIKPANIIVRPDGSPVLVDFGAVRNVFQSADDEGSTMVGTHGYMPHEQSMGRASAASDLYALGATFLHLVTGRRPADFLNDDGVIAVPANLPGGSAFQGVMVRLLAHSPSARFASAREARAALMGGTSAGNAVTMASRTGRAPGPRVELAPAPRPMDRELEGLVREIAYSATDLMAPNEKHDGRITMLDGFLIGVFSLATLGTMPLIFWRIAATRRARLRHFFSLGVPATGRIRSMEREDVAFQSYLTVVRYEFEADGELQRASDLVLPAIADRWDVGMQVDLLVIPTEDYDSVVINR